jgi:uncharacterized protein YqfB (UPF0267 family)
MLRKNKPISTNRFVQTLVQLKDKGDFETEKEATKHETKRLAEQIQTLRSETERSSPDNTTDWEFKQEMRTPISNPPDSSNQKKDLTFAEEYVTSIIDEEKTATVRYDDADAITVGDNVAAVTEAGSQFSTLKITRTASLNAVEALSFIEMVGAKYGSNSVQELIAGVGKHYSDQIRPSTTVRVVVFEVIDTAK